MCNFGNISANVHRTSRDTGKRMALFDLGHQIDLKYTLERGDSIQYLSIWLSCKYLTFSLRTYSANLKLHPTNLSPVRSTGFCLSKPYESKIKELIWPLKSTFLHHY